MKNQVIQQMARAMLLNKDIPMKFWGEVVNTTCHIANKVYFRARTKNESYKICKGKKPKVQYFQVLGSKCYILRIKKMWKNSMQKVMKGFSLGAHPIVELIMSTTKGQKWLWN